MYEMRIYLLNNTQPYRDDEDEGYAGATALWTWRKSEKDWALKMKNS